MTQKERLEELSEKIEILAKNQNRILYLLENDDTTGAKGLVAEVRSIKNNLNGLLDREKIFKAKSTVWGMVGAALISGVIWFGKLLLTKVV